jgi:hypothetical protein
MGTAPDHTMRAIAGVRETVRWYCRRAPRDSETWRESSEPESDVSKTAAPSAFVDTDADGDAGATGESVKAEEETGNWRRAVSASGTVSRCIF